MTIDWSKAPEGYSIWIEEIAGTKGGTGWHREDEDRYTDQRGRYWLKSSARLYSVYLNPGPEWTGEGLPPVGTVCECRVVSGADWVECEVVAHKHKDAHVYAIAFVDENTVMLSGGVRFRPIRTAEQIAAEEKQNAWLAGIAAEYDQETADKCAAVLVAGGYRKESAQ